MALEITAANFEQEVLKSDKLVMVDFFATWCGPCKRVAPIVEELATEYSGKMVIGKLDVDDAMEIAQKYRVMSVPSFLFFKNGEVIESVRGALTKAEFEEKINALI